MDTTTPRLVVVPHDQLGELIELASLAVDRLPQSDPLHGALRGSIAQTRMSTIPEP